MCAKQSLKSDCAHARSDQSLFQSLEHSMTIKLPTEHLLEFLSLRGGHRLVSHVGNHMSRLITQILWIFSSSTNQEDMVTLNSRDIALILLF